METGKMSSEQKTVFISYRRSSGWAQADILASALRDAGYLPFLDTEELAGGVAWRPELRLSIEKSAHFLLLLTEDCLARCADPQDVVRKEIEHAFRTKRNFVPVMDPHAQSRVSRYGCPADLEYIFSRQGFELTRDRVEMQTRIKKNVNPKQGAPPYSRQRKTAPGLENQFLVVHSGDTPSLGDAIRLQRIEFIEALKQRETEIHELETNSRQRGPNALAAYRLLTCKAAVILLDKGAYLNGLRKRSVSILAWRREMGLPAVVLKMPDVPGELPNQFRPLNGFPPFPFDAHKSPQEMADIVVAQIKAQQENWDRKVDPVAEWLANATALLSQMPIERLKPIAKGHLEPTGVSTDKLVRFIAARLLVADLKKEEIAKQVWRFLQPVTKDLRARPNVPSSNIDEFLDMVRPLWVGMSAGRRLLHASRVDKVCGLQLPQSRFAHHPVKRAVANGLGYDVVDLGSTVVGELADTDLANRFAETLRSGLGAQSDEEVQFQADLKDGIFATLNANGISLDKLQKLLDGLRTIYPEVTFVLASDAEPDSHIWDKLSPRVRMAIKHPDDEVRKKVEYAVRAIELIASGR